MEMERDTEREGEREGDICDLYVLANLIAGPGNNCDHLGAYYIILCSHYSICQKKEGSGSKLFKCLLPPHFRRDNYEITQDLGYSFAQLYHQAGV